MWAGEICSKGKRRQSMRGAILVFFQVSGYRLSEENRTEEGNQDYR
jgi:hypothetical protein